MIRFGIVGAGNIAEKFVRDCKISDAKVVAIASRDYNKALDFKNRFDLNLAFGSYAEMAESTEIDAVYIATPHNYHKEQSILFMNHKKHVLCEKPIAVNTHQFLKMIDVSKKNNVLLMEAMWTSFLPATRKVKQVANHLGRLLEMDIEFGYSLIDNYPDSGRLLNPNLAGGSILDIGVYPISFMHLLKGHEIRDIKAEATLHENGVDLDCKMEITYQDQSIARLKSSIQEEYSNNAKLVFEKGTIIVEDFSRSTSIIVNGVHEHIPMLGEGFVHQINDFVITISDNKTENDIMTHEASLMVLKTMDEVRQIVKVSYPFEKEEL